MIEGKLEHGTQHGILSWLNNRADFGFMEDLATDKGLS